MTTMLAEAKSQSWIDARLRWAIIFSLIWLFGFGSAYAFAQGLRVKREIDRSGGLLRGKRRAWWCLIFGAAGMALWFPMVVVGIFNRMR